MASFYNNYYRYYRPFYPSQIPSCSSDKDQTCTSEDTSHEKSKSSNENEKSSRFYSFGPINFKNPFFTDMEEPIFEILGIQLYLDDIIILGLLFFLYQEGVQDEMLFIALILLLLS